MKTDARADLEADAPCLLCMNGGAITRTEKELTIAICKRCQKHIAYGAISERRITERLRVVMESSAHSESHPSDPSDSSPRGT